jgi:hypothetical protein
VERCRPLSGSLKESAASHRELGSTPSGAATLCGNSQPCSYGYRISGDELVTRKICALCLFSSSRYNCFCRSSWGPVRRSQIACWGPTLPLNHDTEDDSIIDERCIEKSTYSIAGLSISANSQLGLMDDSASLKSIAQLHKPLTRKLVAYLGTSEGIAGDRRSSMQQLPRTPRISVLRRSQASQ